LKLKENRKKQKKKDCFKRNLKKRGRKLKKKQLELNSKGGKQRPSKKGLDWSKKQRLRRKE